LIQNNEQGHHLQNKILHFSKLYEEED